MCLLQINTHLLWSAGLAPRYFSYSFTRKQLKVVCDIPQQFNRSMRRYSVKECCMSVTAHGIYSITEVREPACTLCARDECFLALQAKFLKASSEREVFSILKLAYLEPRERNC